MYGNRTEHHEKITQACGEHTWLFSCRTAAISWKTKWNLYWNILKIVFFFFQYKVDRISFEEFIGGIWNCWCVSSFWFWFLSRFTTNLTNMKYFCRRIKVIFFLKNRIKINIRTMIMMRKNNFKINYFLFLHLFSLEKNFNLVYTLQCKLENSISITYSVYFVS